MAINPSAIATQSVADPATPVVLEMVPIQPSTSGIINPSRPPGQLVGFFNGSTNGVELYVVNSAGLRWLRVV